MDVPIHILVVDDKDNEYEQYLRAAAPQHPNIWNILMISYDYIKTKRKKYKRKYFQKGQTVCIHQYCSTLQPHNSIHNDTDCA